MGAMGLFRAPAGLLLRHWPGESTALARLPRAGTTHLVEAGAAAVLDALIAHPSGLGVGDIVRVLGIRPESDAEAEAGVRRLVEGLADAGLVHRVADDADPRPVPGG